MNELHVNDNFEQAVIGSLVLDPTQFDVVTSIVSEQDFADDENRELFRLLCDIHDLGKPISDIKLVVQEAKKRELQASPGDIAESFASVPNARNAVYYAQEVAELSRIRKLADLQESLKDQLTKSSANSGEIVGFIESRISTINSTSRLDVDDARAAIEKYEANDQGGNVAAMSGLYTLDEQFGGFFGGELIVPAARLGTGKTALGWQIMIHNLKKGRPCMFVSLEMSTRSLMERHLASATGIPSIDIRKNSLTGQQRGKIDLEKERFAEYPVAIYPAPAATVRNIAAAAKLKKSGGGLSLLVVDYFQLIKSPNRTRDEHVRLEEVSRDLKVLALDLDIPVIVLAQLNRQADNVIPRTSHLAGSDGIGRDADQVLLLHRKGSGTDLRVDKHRFVEDDAAIELQFRNGIFSDSGTPWTA